MTTSIATPNLSSFYYLISISNSTIPGSTSKFTLPMWIKIVIVTFMILIDISAFVGNALVIAAFFRTRRLQTVTNYFIASLAYADLLVAVFVLPLSIYYFYRDRSWKLGLILCDLWVSSDVLLCTASILNLTCISVDRYMAITKPLTYTAYRSKFLARVMIVCVWIVSAIITCPPIFGWRDANRKTQVEQNNECELNTATGYVIYSALGSFYIPAFVMFFVYIRIFKVVYEREGLIKKFHHNQDTNLIDNNNKITPAFCRLTTSQKNVFPGNDHTKQLKDDETNVQQQKTTKMSKTFSSVCCCCFCCCKRKKQQQQQQPKINESVVFRFGSGKAGDYNYSGSDSVNSPVLNNICRPCTLNMTKSNGTVKNQDDVKHRRNYFRSGFPTAAPYTFRTGDSPCFELKCFDYVETQQLSIKKCRSTSSESHYIVEDLNAALSRSRQLKENMNNKHTDDLKSSKSSPSTFTLPAQKDDQRLISDENRAASIFHASYEVDNGINNKNNDDDEDLFRLVTVQRSQNKLARSVDELTTASIHNYSLLNKPSSYSSLILTKRQKDFSSSRAHPNLAYQNGGSTMKCEPTRINRRTNGKLKHSRIDQNTSIKSMTSQNSSFKTKLNYLLFCCPNKCNGADTANHHSFNKVRTSLTNEEDDEDTSNEKSSNETNKTPCTMTASPSLLNERNNLIIIPNNNSLNTNSNRVRDVNRRERLRFMKEQKTAKTLAIVVGGFILFWLPFFIMYLIGTTSVTLDNNLTAFLTWLGYFNSVINPFIYAYCSKQFRMAFWNLTFGNCTKKSTLSVSLKKQEYQRRTVNNKD